ncbi:ABC transporter ATP-binding protein [Thermus antranikianii]|uniref:ATP-binding cassette domain-containing protein n=1 Tax=Thermus antranikianii TaxID=88190 RepID=A0ABY7RRC2_9DEIN|nr:ATP-binding cassette domain-containing protein [Thermus antranikianii]QWK20884.1 MAG: ATP-binding cassette domain-containing protein [Thermus antranikianii]WCM40218.1 ATP-binding cassette domain-containing protein [Thermus antranikianii]
MNPVLEAIDLGFSYGNGYLFRGVSLRLCPGEALAILGPSGSGKTTLLHLLAGLLSLQEGEVYWEGTPIRGLPEGVLARRRLRFMGLVFQHHFLFPELTALENVLAPGYLAGRVDRAFALWLLSRLGLRERADFLPQRLSGGERQRVAVARALYLRPRLLLADEPTASLDRTQAREVLRLMRELAREVGAALLFSTHDEALVEGLPALRL